MTATTAKPKRVKDTDEVVSGVRRQIRALENRAAGEDPWIVADMIELQAELERATLRTVKRMREAGVTWQTIGFSLNLNAIQCHKKFAHKLDSVEI